MNKTQSNVVIFQYRDEKGHLHTATGVRNPYSGQVTSAFYNFSLKK